MAMRFRFALALLSLLLPTGAGSQGVVQFGGQSVTTGAAFPAGVNFASGQALYAPTSATLQFGSPFSVSVWIQGTFVAGTNQVTNIVTNQPSSFLAGFDLANYTGFPYPLLFGIRSTFSPASFTCANAFACTRSTLVTGTGKHLLVSTFDGTTAQLYVDGVLQDQVVPGLPYTPGTNFWQVGQTSGTFILYDMRVYTRVLSFGEDRNIYALGTNNLVPNSGTLNSGMAAHWLLNGCTTPCPDTSGNGNDLVYDTAPTVAVTVPAPAATISGASVTLTATATDPVGVTSVQFLVDGSSAGAAITTGPYTTTFDSTTLSDGAHTIAALAVNASGNSATSATVTVTSSNSTPALNYYFAAAGSDSNNCLTTGTACQTITKANSITYRGGDVRHWNKGDTFTGCLNIIGSGAGINYLGRRSLGMTDTNYGTGALPIITPNCTAASAKIGVINWTAADGWILDGLNITGDSGGNAGRCISFKNPDFSNSHGTVTIQNSAFHTCHDGLDNDYGGYLFWDPSANNGTKMMDHFTILNNTGNGLSGPTSTDENFMDSYNYTCTTQFDVVQGNLIFNIGGKNTGFGGSEANGIVFVAACPGTSGATFGGISQFNVIHTDGTNLVGKCGSFYSSWSYQSNRTVHRMNESYDNTQTGGCDGGSWDLDDGVTESLVERNYSHNNFGPCAIYFGSASNNTIRWNICDGDAIGIGGVFGLANYQGGINYTYNNVFVQNTSLNYAVSIFGCAGAGSVFANNIISTENQGRAQNNLIFMETTSGGACTTGAGGLTLKNNDWWGTTRGFQFWCRNGGTAASTTYAACAMQIGETGGIGADPLWISPYGNTTIGNTTVGPNSTGPNGYKLQGGSPAKPPAGSALNGLPALYNGQGTLDYFGVTLPCPNWPIGASCS